MSQHLLAVSLWRATSRSTEQPLIADMAAFLGEWHDAGADELDRHLGATGRAGGAARCRRAGGSGRVALGSAA